MIDLGAGDGVIILTAAQEAYKRKLNTQFIAVEINPILILVLSLRRLLHPNKMNIKIVRADMFKIIYSSLVTSHYPLVTFYLYASPWLIEQAVGNIKRQIKKFDLLSYYYPIPFLPDHKEELIEGVHKVYKYTYE
jgi:predicted RNA methylase